MKKKLMMTIGAGLSGALMLTSVTPATAQSFWFGAGSDGDSYGWYDDYYDYDYDYDWPQRQYYYRDIIRPGISIEIGRSGRNHVARCEARYRSYDPGSDTYVGYDGRRHRCRL